MATYKRTNRMGIKDKKGGYMTQVTKIKKGKRKGVRVRSFKIAPPKLKRVSKKK